MKQKPWFDEETGKRRGVTVSFSLRDEKDWKRGLKRVAKLLGVKPLDQVVGEREGESRDE